MRVVAFAVLMMVNGDSCNATDAQTLAEARAQFRLSGYCVLRGILSEAEVDAIESNFDVLTHPSAMLIAEMKRDYGDQSQGHGIDPADFALINVNNPGRCVSHSAVACRPAKHILAPGQLT